MAGTKIEWADVVWNPVTGCSKVSPGCDHCYAARMAKRLAGRCGYRKKNPFKVTIHWDKLDLPLYWKKPRRVFVNSMGDLFHLDVPQNIIIYVWRMMALARHHTYMILTKRPEIMLEWVMRYEPAPQKNIWLGVTAENQEEADRRVPVLLQIPAEKRFVSVEPMLGPVDLTKYLTTKPEPIAPHGQLLWARYRQLDWVICGGETGPGARMMNREWAQALRDQCIDAGVPFFFKGWGAYPRGMENKIDGVTWEEFPAEYNFKILRERSRDLVRENAAFKEKIEGGDDVSIDE